MNSQKSEKVCLLVIEGNHHKEWLNDAEDGARRIEELKREGKTVIPLTPYWLLNRYVEEEYKRQNRKNRR